MIIYTVLPQVHGESVLPHGPTVPNHDSDLGDEEIKRLTQEGVDLIINGAVALKERKTLPGYKQLWELASGLEKGKNGKGGSYEIRIKKGIHQFTKFSSQYGRMPHITATFCTDGLITGPTLHIWLSIITTPLPGRTGYVARSVSANEGGPFFPDCTFVSAPPGAPGRTRGNSISKGDFILESNRIRMAAAEAEGWKYLNAIADVYEAGKPAG